jgi:murein DD-endopeptidase MepM/ murein hydrolase activator NlpD
MKIIRQIAIVLSALCLLIIPISRSYAADMTPEELKRAIEDKSKALLEINDKITQAEQDLKDTESKSKSLQNELKKSDYTINQLNLSIRSSELNIQKLNLEIEALKYDIGDTESQIDIKRLGVAELLRELQKKDTENVLVTLLKNKSIAESLDEVQNILDINSGLSAEVSSLQILNDDLSNKLTASSAKKAKVELENKNLKNRKVILQNQKTERQSLLTQTKNQEKNYQALIAQLEKDQDAVSKELDETETKLRASFDPNLLPVKRSGVLAYPVKLKKDGGVAAISQNYGQTFYSARLYKSNFHNGLDFGVPVGTPVFAAEDGIVVAADNNDKSSWQKYQYGQHIMIEHQNNLNTLYAHLSVIGVKKGQAIKRGELIGYSGNTGYSTGPHLHFGVYWKPSVLFKTLLPAKGLVPVGVTIDPQGYL